MPRDVTIFHITYFLQNIYGFGSSHANQSSQTPYLYKQRILSFSLREIEPSFLPLGTGRSHVIYFPRGPRYILLHLNTGTLKSLQGPWARGQEAWTLGLTLLYSICKVFGKSVKFQTLQSAHLKECD